MPITRPSNTATDDSNDQRPLISVVSPIYGCRENLDALVEGVRTAFKEEDLNWELILIDDRGPDKPWEMIQYFAASDANIRGIRLSRNHGQHLAIWAGLEVARGDYVAVIDCDLQDDPSIIPDLYRYAEEQDVEAVIVDRGTWSDSRMRRLASTLFYKVVRWLAGIQIGNVGNFGIYGRRMVDTLLQFQEQEVFLPIMVSLSGYETKKYRVDRDDRKQGESSYNALRLMRLAIAIVVRFSDRPLKLSVLIGIFFSSMAVLVSIGLFVLWLAGRFTVQGWTSTILSLWFLSGLILATLGIHGFYLGRVFREVKGRPRILIQETTDDADHM